MLWSFQVKRYRKFKLISLSKNCKKLVTMYIAEKFNKIRTSKTVITGAAALQKCKTDPTENI